MPDVRARWSQLGADPIDNTPAQFADWLDSEAVKWTKIVKDSGARAD
jgi:tripartite-type tricarboxylate transporter receptor subunit TctC